MSQRPESRLPLAVPVLTVGAFIMMTSEFVVAGVLPQIAADTHVSVPRAGALITVFAVGTIVGAPLMALLTLRLSHRLTLMLALAVFAAGHAVVGLGTQLGVLLAARFVTALAAGAFWAVAAVVATEVAPGARARAVSVVNAGGLLATVLGVPLGAFAAQFVGWRGAFWALAALAVATVPLLARWVPAEDHRPGGPSSVRSELGALRSRRLWLVLAACAATMGGVLAAYSYVVPLLSAAGVRPSLVPLALAGFGAGALVGSLLGGRLGDRHPHVVTLAAPAVATVLLVALALSIGAAVVTVTLLVLLGLFGLGGNAVLVALAVRYAGPGATLGSALAAAAFNVGTAVSSWVGALALESRWGATGPAGVGAVISALSLAPVLALLVLARSRASASA